MSKNVKRLSITDIDNLPNVPTKEVVIDEWGVSILLKGITKAKQIELAKLIDTEKVDAFEYQKMLLKVCVVEPELDDDAINKLYEKDSKVIDKINLAIADLNGFGGSATADEFPE
jgi:hypothetical protein